MGYLNYLYCGWITLVLVLDSLFCNSDGLFFRIMIVFIIVLVAFQGTCLLTPLRPSLVQKDRMEVEFGPSITVKLWQSGVTVIWCFF